ncbi:hypothetical protein [Dokdonia sp.]|uniref:hypothetical protein n=1 Tax=Dokdonia sp. TaxID=2024995 RepID=UPI0032635850
MKFLFLLLLVSSISYSQTKYTFDEVLEYSYVSLKKQKKWKWMQLHNSKDNSYQASIHVEGDNEFWFNLTFHNTQDHAKFRLDNYVLADGYNISFDEEIMHNVGVLINGARTKKNTNINNYFLKLLPSENPLIVRFEILPKKEKIKKRKKLNTYYYEIDISNQEHEINFIVTKSKLLFKKMFKNTKGIITKRCIRDSDDKMKSCISLENIHTMNSRVEVN